MATEQTITISGTPTVVSGVTVPFTKSSDLEIYIGKGLVEKVVLNNAGAGYADATNAALEFSGGGGSSAALTVDVANGQVSLDNAGVPTNKGTGYTTSPIVGFGNISGGTGASATAEIYAKKTLTTDYTISGTSGSATITFTSALANGDKVLVKRVTDVTTAVNTFNAGSAITAVDLNKSFDQIRYRVEELPEITSTAVTNGDKGDISVSGSTWTIDNSAITTAKILDSQVTSAKIANDTIVNADVNSSAAILASKLSFTQSATGGTARTILTKLNELISVKDFGAVGDGSTDDTTAIKNAIEAGDGVNIVYFPAGTYIVKEPIIIPSNSYIKGAGAASTSIKMDSSIGRLAGLGVIGNWDTTVENVLVEDITFDFNTARWHGYTSSSSPTHDANFVGVYSNTKTGTYSRTGTTVTVSITNHGFEIGETVNVDCTSGTGTDEEQKVATVADANTFTYTSGTSATSSGNCSVKASVNCVNRNALTIYNSKYVTLNRVRCLHGQRHSLDITSSFRRKDTSDETTTAYYLTATTYMHKGAQYITVNDCYFTGAGDDNLTTHFSSDILITNCLSESPRGGYSTGDHPNTNCFEIDDGSRNVQLYNNRAYKGNNGLEIKGHGYAPAPYNVIVDGLEIINCVGGVECHHSNWITQTDSTSTAWKANGGTTNATVPGALAAAYTSGQLSSLSDDGHSATANNVSFSNVQIIAPCNQTFKHLDSSGHDATAPQPNQPSRCFEVSGYNGVQINNVLISDGSKDRNLTADGYVAGSNLVTTVDTAGIMDGRIVHIRAGVRNLIINNLTINGFYNKTDIGIEIISTTDESFSINNLNIIDGPAQAIYAKGTDNRYLGTIDNYNIYQTFDPTASIAGTYGANRSEGNKAWKDLAAEEKYAFRINPQSINLGQGTIKGYASGDGIKPQEYTPLVYGGDQLGKNGTTGSSGAVIRSMASGTIDDVKYILNGNACTVFMKQANLTPAGTAATGDLRIMLPFRPLVGGFPCAVYSDAANFATTYATVTANVVANEVYDDVTGTAAGAKYGYVHIKGIKDNGDEVTIQCDTITADEVDILFTMTYLIDLSADPNF